MHNWLWLPTDYIAMFTLFVSCWLFTTRRNTLPGNHLVPCVAELVGSCILVHAYLPDLKCLFYPSGLLLCFSIDHMCLVPVNNMVLLHSMVCDGWHCFPLLWTGGSVCVPAVTKSTFFVLFNPRTELSAYLPSIWTRAVLARTACHCMTTSRPHTDESGNKPSHAPRGIFMLDVFRS